MLNILFAPLKNTLSIKAKSIKALMRLELTTLKELLFYRPHTFIIKDITPNLSKLQVNQLIQAKVIIQDIKLPARVGGSIKIVAVNDSGSILLVFFNKIAPVIFSKLKLGSSHIITGKVQFFNGCFQITHPEFIFKQELADFALEPQYRTTYGLANKQLYYYILKSLQIVEHQVLKEITPKYLKEYIESVFKDLCIIHLYKFDCQYQQISKLWAQSIKNLAAKELFANQASLANISKYQSFKAGKSYTKAQEVQQLVLGKLNFTLTKEQETAVAEIESDQQANRQMIRLLQGDVGSGKTLVALLTLLNVSASGSQAVLMAPLDLLANQHYLFFKRALVDSGISCGLLTGKTALKTRKLLYQQLATGAITLLVGTHALFQEQVHFKDLGYIVIDEQHKFGVTQRLQLINKAASPDVLIMTATPIPRSLTLTMFGDIATSKLQSKPSNRLPVITTTISTNKIDDVIGSLAIKMQAGEQIYWVCPFIDQNDELLSPQQQHSYSNVTLRAQKINEIYPGVAKVIHGKMTADEKNLTMTQFKCGAIKILVATTIIEVGIDIPKATLIVIENAEKFGLAQLHQLRGRVGRGERQSYCILLYNPLNLSKGGRKRLAIMRTSNDGFYIARQDMLLRGSGEILGTRQSGEPQFFFADLNHDLQLLEQANARAMNIASSKFVEFQIKLFAKTTANLVNSG